MVTLYPEHKDIDFVNKKNKFSSNSDHHLIDNKSIFQKEDFDLPSLTYDSFVDINFEAKEEEMDAKVELTDIPLSQNAMLISKRKSESWNAKPLEKPVAKEPSFEEPFISTFDGMYDDLFAPLELQEENGFEPFAFDRRLSQGHSFDEFNLFSSSNSGELHQPDCADDAIFIREIAANTLVKTRKSEDWSSRPKLKRAKSMPLTDDPTKRRVKWSHDELKMLWKGILQEGNNWKEISKILKSRSYFQIKDKGRRLLFLRGWTTGRNKNDTDDGNRKAKEIAQQVLAEMN